MNTNTISQSNEQRYYDALRRISKNYMTPEQIKRDAEKSNWLDGTEYLEMAYENIQSLAAGAIYKRRRPKQ